MDPHTDSDDTYMTQLRVGTLNLPFGERRYARKKCWQQDTVESLRLADVDVLLVNGDVRERTLKMLIEGMNALPVGMDTPPTCMNVEVIAPSRKKVPNPYSKGLWFDIAVIVVLGTFCGISLLGLSFVSVVLCNFIGAVVVVAIRDKKQEPASCAMLFRRRLPDRMHEGRFLTLHATSVKNREFSNTYYDVHRPEGFVVARLQFASEEASERWCSVVVGTRGFEKWDVPSERDEVDKRGAPLAHRLKAEAKFMWQKVKAMRTKDPSMTASTVAVVGVVSRHSEDASMYKEFMDVSYVDALASFPENQVSAYTKFPVTYVGPDDVPKKHTRALRVVYSGSEENCANQRVSKRQPTRASVRDTLLVKLPEGAKVESTQVVPAALVNIEDDIFARQSSIVVAVLNVPLPMVLG